MCIPIMAAAMLASTAVSAIGAIRQGNQAAAVGEYQSQQAAADAEAARGEAAVQAAQIRKAGQRQKSSAIAAQAGAGVAVDTGTAELINTEIVQGAEQDALTAILSGNTRGRQLKAQGDMSKIAGNNAKTAGYLNATSTALGAGAKFADGWRNTATPGPMGAGMYGYTRDN